ncbi:hypothetical protein V500_02863 [Pseudogymnoascus sp. VKM F-4518 (FW-2643)]|nr:hypothetical protein V500_02863 [Pseudogymnoascus sp. VKM F-4518 (FW-2643)]
MSTTSSNYSMGSDSVSRTASIATKEDAARTLHPKRGRVQNEGDESITLPRAKRHRANTGILQPRDINIRPLDKLAGSKAIPPPYPACSDVTREFEYSETEIKILKVIGSGDHAVVYRIAAGGKTFALKVHKYKNEAISAPGTPKPNVFFESERDAYTRLSSMSDSPLAPIPKYHGYMRFKEPPQVNGPGSIPRKLFKSTTYRPAVYTDFLTHRGHNKSIQNDPWRDYFLNKSGNCILQGLVLDEIVKTRHICDSDISNPDIARSGREGLEAFHERGVLHGDVKNRLNAMVSASENRVIWVDFSMGETNANISDTSFERKASREIRHWNRYFKSSIARLVLSPDPSTGSWAERLDCDREDYDDEPDADSEHDEGSTLGGDGSQPRSLATELDQKYKLDHISSISYTLAVDLNCLDADDPKQKSAVCLLADRNIVRREYGSSRSTSGMTFYPLGFNTAGGCFVVQLLPGVQQHQAADPVQSRGSPSEAGDRHGGDDPARVGGEYKPPARPMTQMRTNRSRGNPRRGAVDTVSARGADVKKHAGQTGNALQAAVIAGGMEIVKLLIERGADANEEGGEFDSPLIAAAKEGHEQIAQLLIEKGAEVNKLFGGLGTAVVGATLADKDEMVRFLIKEEPRAHAAFQGCKDSPSNPN